MNRQEHELTLGIHLEEAARQRFEQALPERVVHLHLSSREPGAVRAVLDQIAYSPLEYFRLLGIVSPQDCLALVEHQNHFKLWERIANSYSREASQIADEAKQSLGKENLRVLSISLVHLDNKSLSTKSTIYITNKALSGIKLASALDVSEMETVVIEFSNLARMDTTSFDSEMFTFLYAGVYSFSRAFYEQQLSPEDIQASIRIITDLKTFAKKKREWISSSDDDNRRKIAQSMIIARRKASNENLSPNLVEEMDSLMGTLGYHYKKQRPLDEYTPLKPQEKPL